MSSTSPGMRYMNLTTLPTQGAWTAEEDRIFLELVAEHVKSKMWEVVKADGRLAYRGGPGVRAHAIAMVSLHFRVLVLWTTGQEAGY